MPTDEERERDLYWNEVQDPPRHYDRTGRPISPREWADLYEDEEYRRIAATTIAGRWWVSTVWLGLDHSYGTFFDSAFRRGDRQPLIFETMVFDRAPGSERPHHDLEVERYTTEEQARAGHEHMVELARTWTDGPTSAPNVGLSP